MITIKRLSGQCDQMKYAMLEMMKTATPSFPHLHTRYTS